MTAKELKRLSRSDLLEMLLALRKENDQLRAQLEQAQIQLKNRRIHIDNSGSIADAALHLNGVFEAAQAACDQYIFNVQERCEEIERQTQKKCDALLSQAKDLSSLNY